MSNRNTKRVDENRTMRRDLTLSASAKKPALSQADNSKGRKAGKRKLNNPNVTPVSKVSKVSKVNKVNKVNNKVNNKGTKQGKTGVPGVCRAVVVCSL